MGKNVSQGDKDERGVEGATTENATGSASVNGKTRTSQGSKPRSVSVSSSRKSAKGSTSGAESSKEGVEVSKKSSVVSTGGGGEGGLMRPTKSRLNHLGESGGAGGGTKGPTLNGTGTAATQSGCTADEGTTTTMRKSSSQKTNPDSSSLSSSVSSSSGDKMLTSSTSSSSSESSSSGKSKALKEKSVVNKNNKANGSEICQNGKTSEKPVSTINGGKESVAAKRAVNGKESRTTMIRLHPGRTDKLSAYLENQEKPGSRTWLTEAETGEVEDALCGLEISFSSVPQDIAIKILPSTQGDLGNLEDIEK